MGNFLLGKKRKNVAFRVEKLLNAFEYQKICVRLEKGYLRLIVCVRLNQVLVVMISNSAN